MWLKRTDAERVLITRNTLDLQIQRRKEALRSWGLGAFICTGTAGCWVKWGSWLGGVDSEVGKLCQSVARITRLWEKKTSFREKLGVPVHFMKMK